VKERLSRDNSSRELFPSKKSTSGKGQLDQLEEAVGAATMADFSTPIATTDTFQIRGMARERAAGQGLAIKGAAANTTATELFPSKFGSNVGKELFADKLEGRGRRRQKAEDMFY
jgi:hypothetical protein